MGTYSNYKDAPDQIKKEGQEISLTFTRNGDNTASVCWNIPRPVDGCASADQAYDGIVITVSNKPVNYTTTSPVDGVYYNGDTTADEDLHLGDKLDYANVLAALYHDKETTCVIVQDVLDKTPYYFSAYAVDKVGRYHKEGVHAYSLPSTNQTFVDSEEHGARHDIEIDSDIAITDQTLTGLLSGTEYTLGFVHNTECYDTTIRGTEAQTYSDLTVAINKELAQIDADVDGPYPPNTGSYYVDVLNRKVYSWNGYLNEEIVDAMFWDTDPTTPTLDTYWFNPTTDTLYVYESSGWVTVSNVIKFTTDPTTPLCDTVWFDGVDIWQWDGTVWCKLPTYIQSTNPLLPPSLTCSTYWVNNDSEFFVWDTTLKKWNDELVILYDKDPNTITTGDYWFNETDEKAYIYLTGAFSEMTNIRYEEADSEGELPMPVANHYWYIPSTGQLFKRNVSNTLWTELLISSYPTDPTNRASCNLWWNTSSSIDELYVWDEANSLWALVDTFFQTEIDPSISESLPDNSAWYNPTTNTIELIMGTNCLPVDFIDSPIDPTVPTLGDVWFDMTNSVWYVWNSVEWVSISPVYSTTDPLSVDIGDVWFDTVNNLLYTWDGSVWVNRSYSLEPLFVLVGTKWYNTVDELLYEWNGTTWVLTNPFVYLTLVLGKNTCLEGKDILCFMTDDIGCNQSLVINPDTSTSITSLTLNVIWYEAVIGTSQINPRPQYKQLGVGTDGSPDERRKLQTDIRISLGAPSVEVELTKEQLDKCIDNALLQIRKFSSYGYTRGLFFLDSKPNQQKYILSDECVGFNKITDINAIYRHGPYRGNGNGAGHNSVFDFGALQQLYSAQNFDILSYHLVSQYMEELEVLFARHIMFQWTPTTRELKLYQLLVTSERLLVDGSIERTEQDLITDREVALWIQRWAIAEAKMTLSQTRGKYQSLPGPNGSTTLNSQELITQAENEKAELTVELADMSMQDVLDVGMRSHFILG